MLDGLWVGVRRFGDGCSGRVGRVGRGGLRFIVDSNWSRRCWRRGGPEGGDGRHEIVALIRIIRIIRIRRLWVGGRFAVWPVRWCRLLRCVGFVSDDRARRAGRDRRAGVLDCRLWRIAGSRLGFRGGRLVGLDSSGGWLCGRLRGGLRWGRQRPISCVAGNRSCAGLGKRLGSGFQRRNDLGDGRLRIGGDPANPGQRIGCAGSLPSGAIGFTTGFSTGLRSCQAGLVTRNEVDQCGIATGERQVVRSSHFLGRVVPAERVGGPTALPSGFRRREAVVECKASHGRIGMSGCSGVSGCKQEQQNRRESAGKHGGTPSVSQSVSHT